MGCLPLKFPMPPELAGQKQYPLSVPYIQNAIKPWTDAIYPSIHPSEGEEVDMADDADPEQPRCEPDKTTALLPNSTCSCLNFSCFGSRRPTTLGLPWWDRIRTSQIHADGQWWSRGLRVLMKLREWSEIVAGPRWKTFIRRFNRNRSAGSRPGKFQYDPLSYAMNFDEGPRQVELDDETDDYSGFRNFSARYASIPVPLKAGPTVLGKDVGTVA